MISHFSTIVIVTTDCGRKVPRLTAFTGPYELQIRKIANLKRTKSRESRMVNRVEVLLEFLISFGLPLHPNVPSFPAFGRGQ